MPTLFGVKLSAIKVVPLIATKQWREDIPYDSDDVPRIAGSEAEKNQLALDSEYNLLEFAEITWGICFCVIILDSKC